MVGHFIFIALYFCGYHEFDSISIVCFCAQGVAIFVSLIGVLDLNYFKPFRNNVVFWILQASLTVTTIKYVCALMISASPKGTNDSSFTLFLIVIDVSTFLMFAGGVVACMCLMHREVAGTKPPSAVTVVPAMEQQQELLLRKQITALKWQSKIRRTMRTNTSNISRTGTINRVKSKRTRRVLEIQKTHENHRNMALKNIEKQQIERRNSLQLRVQARTKKRKDEQEANNGAAVAAAAAATATEEKTIPATAREHAKVRATQMDNAVDRMRLSISKIMKSPAMFQKWLTHHDKTSTHLLSRLRFAHFINKILKKINKGKQRAELQKKLIDAVWVSAKQGSRQELEFDDIEHEVVKQWVFANSPTL